LLTISRHIPFIVAGFFVGYLYYHHIWLEVERLCKRKRDFVFSFWFRYGVLAIVLTILFKYFPYGRFGIIMGLLSARPAYIYLNSRRIFGGTDAG